MPGSTAREDSHVCECEALMINLPLFHSLDVTDYGLFPGDKEDTPGLHVRFQPGLTLVLGANSLGKTTLVTMLYRLLTGPSEIPAMLQDSELGTASLQVRDLRPGVQTTFGHRVADGAIRASARLVLHIGTEEVSVERNLRDLTLRSFSIGGAANSDDEQEYQEAMARLANVSSFGDWILLLRYIVFYFEDRRSLIWDPSAQRQLLRILFLGPQLARDWTTLERDILESDSEFRNLRAVANRQQRTVARHESLAANEQQVREELIELDQFLKNAHESLDKVNFELPDIENRHEKARLHFFTLEQERESKYRELERAQLIAVNARLPRVSDSVRYILAQILSEANCLACGNTVPNTMESMKERIRGNECVVCGSDLTTVGDHIPVYVGEAELNLLHLKLTEIDGELESARNVLEESSSERGRTTTRIRELTTSIADRTARLETLLALLPPGESQLYERRQELASLRSNLELLQLDLEDKRESFELFISEANTTIEAQAYEIQESFGEYAKGFLFEDCHLVWSPRAAQLGQSGRRFDFPAFGLELGGSNFSATVRRSGPDDVSESQREFIDISFRMALAKLGTSGHVTTLVVDAPESSLDAVFVNRAARVLGAFGRPDTGNRLIVTSNLTSGKLIPALLREATDEEHRTERVVDLLAIAAPTAAVQSLREEYNAARDQLLAQVDNNE